jgi:parvulin-like peptidyl-prolyl isomerase
MAHKKACIIGLLMFSTSCVLGQSAAETSFKQVATLDDAHAFINKYPSLKPVLLILNSQQDTSAVDRQLYKLKIGDIAKIHHSSYKIIEDMTKYTFRASYIYLDGSKLSQPAIDSIRSLILSKYSAGASFESLSAEYTMDGNRKHGDTGFFEPGMMVKEFEEAVRRHAKGDTFTVDVPGNQWYYVVKKTMDNQATLQTTVLEIK